MDSDVLESCMAPIGARAHAPYNTNTYIHTHAHIHTCTRSSGRGQGPGEIAGLVIKPEGERGGGGGGGDDDGAGGGCGAAIEVASVKFLKWAALQSFCVFLH